MADDQVAGLEGLNLNNDGNQAEPPADPAEPPADPAEPPADPVQPPADPPEPPADPVQPPADPVQPQVEPVQQLAAAVHLDLLLQDNALRDIIRGALKYLSNTQNIFWRGQNLQVPYNEYRYQAAYMFLYFPALCHSVKIGLNLFHVNRDCWFENNHLEGINVCSIGGGPGTDVLGFCRYLKDLLRRDNDNRNVVLNATIIDKYCEWKTSWDAVVSKNPDEAHNINMGEYIGYDINIRPTQNVLDSVADAKVILLIKFVSAVIGNRRQNAEADNRRLQIFEANMRELLSNARLGSLMVYGDNSRGDFAEVFKGIATAAGFESVTQRPVLVNRKIPVDAELNKLDKIYTYYHQKKINMSFMLWKKNNTVVRKKQK
ncbi:uncharacterized protein [Antedon mediterranea]|uniref:uncharacterized protein n=1 Tax=Antedon mediterranea TaxID=105859 RepID=UPI003AF49D5D